MDADEDWSAEPGTERLTAFLETKTVWHPKGQPPKERGEGNPRPHKKATSGVG